MHRSRRRPYRLFLSRSGLPPVVSRYCSALCCWSVPASPATTACTTARTTRATRWASPATKPPPGEFDMFRNLFVAAILAALCAGLAFTVIQQSRLTPLIFAAEAFESAAEPAAEAHTHAPGEA